MNDEKARALLLASLVFVDKVILFDTDTPYDLINMVQPDVLVKGGDYKPEDIVGYDIQEAVARCGQQSAACEPASDLYFPPNGKLVFFHSSLSFKFPCIIR